MEPILDKSKTEPIINIANQEISSYFSNKTQSSISSHVNFSNEDYEIISKLNNIKK